jgi:hypothetical protein
MNDTKKDTKKGQFEPAGLGKLIEKQFTSQIKRAIINFVGLKNAFKILSSFYFFISLPNPYIGQSEEVKIH